MKIKRTIYLENEKVSQEMEFELTSNELQTAYDEKQSEYDLMDVSNLFDNMSDEEVVESYGITRSEAEKLFEDMALEMRKNICKYDMHWDVARDNAISSVVSLYLKKRNLVNKEEIKYEKC